MVVHKFARANGSTFYNILSEYPLALCSESIPGVDVSRLYVRAARLDNKPANKQGRMAVWKASGYYEGSVQKLGAGLNDSTKKVSE